MIEKAQQAVVGFLVEGGIRTFQSNGKNLIENTADVFFEKGDRAIDSVFDPIIRISGVIDDFFGW